MEILTQLVFSGIALGMIYAVIAFGYQLTFATSDTLNFGQGDALMLGALVGLTLVGGGKGQLVAEGDDGVDHAQRNAAEHELGQDLHGRPRQGGCGAAARESGRGR